MKICPKCGQATNDDTDEFCTKCGAYFAKEQKEVQQTSAMGAMMGMVEPPKSKAVPVPEGGTLQAGFDHMAAGNFAEAVAQWTSAVRENGQPSDEDYARMVTAAADCIVSSTGDAQAHSRAGLAELAMELDNDLVQDLMVNLASRVPDMRSRNQAADLATEYMYLAMEAFGVFPDLRDVLDSLETVGPVMESIRSAGESLEQDDAGRLESVTTIYISYSALMSDAMRKGIENAGEERMEKLADYWSTKQTLPYANVAYQIASLHTQVSSAKNVGKIMSKLFKKALDTQVEGFVRSYFGPKV